MTKKLINLTSLTLISLAIFSLSSLVNTKGIHFNHGPNPGYFQQWFNEKKNSNGIIPIGLRAEWSAWDKQNNLRRSGENPIDVVTEIGPKKTTGGRLRALLVDWNDNKHYFAGSVSGGLWESTDEGVSWKAVNEHEVNMGVTCITQSPFDSKIIYYGTGETRANSADVSGNGIFKSVDGGKTFTNIFPASKDGSFAKVWAIAHSKKDTNTIFVGTDESGLYKSTNGGVTFTNLTSGSVNDIVCLPNGRVVFTRKGVGIYNINYATNAITASVFPSIGSFGRMEIDYCQNFPNVMYAMAEGTGFSDPMKANLKSSNGGLNWKSITTANNIGSAYSNYCIMLGVCPTDSNKVVVGGVSAGFTTNGGSTWVSLPNGHSDCHVVASIPGKTTFLVGSDGGAYRHNWSALSSTYTNLNNGLAVTQFYAGNFGPENTQAISGAQDNGSHRSLNGVVSKVMGGDGGYGHISLQDPDIAYTSYQNDGINRCDNFTTGGNFYSIGDAAMKADGYDFINSYQINHAEGYQLYYRTNNGLWRTIDGGGEWTKITGVVTGIKAIGVTEHVNPVVYFGGSGGKIFRITNAATATVGTEKSLRSFLPSASMSHFIGCIEPFPDSKSKVYVSFSNNFSNAPRILKGIKMDTDTPQFIDVTGNFPKSLPVNYVQADPLSPDSMIYAATDFGLYYTTNGGKTWEKEMRVPSVAVHEIKLRNADRTLFLFTHGRGMWSATLKPKGLGINKPQQNFFFSVGPNPASEVINVYLPNASDKNTTCSLLDINGKVVSFQKVTNGAKQIQLPVSTLAKGLYFIKMENGQKSSSKKVMINR